jgi:hypothetical protein
LTALKEWAIVCDALEDGSQSILLRKGGILEYKDGFQVTHSCFYLYPTFEHQSIEYLKSNYWAKMEELSRSPNFDDGKVAIIRSWAEVKQIYKIRNINDLLKIKNYHIWSDKYLQMRFNYNSSKPLHLLVIRVYKLVKQIRVQIQPHWSGCKSWVEMNIPNYDRLDNCTDINKLDLIEPVIVDSEFQEICKRLENDLG